MNDQFNHLFMVAKSRLDRVAIAVFSILFGVVVYCLMLPDPVIELPPEKEFEPINKVLPQELPNQSYINATTFRDANANIESSDITANLLESNPFSYSIDEKNDQIDDGKGGGG